MSLEATETFSPAAIRRIGSDAARFLSVGRSLFSRRSRVQITESFPLWMIDPVSVVTYLDAPLEAVARPLDQWYHQLLIDGEPRAFAISSGTEGQCEVVQVMRSALPARVDEAITSIDRLYPDASRVRLIDFAPAHIYAFWFVQGYAEVQMTQIVEAPIGSDFKVGEFIHASQLVPRTRSFLMENRALGLKPSVAEASPVAQPRMEPA